MHNNSNLIVPSKTVAKLGMIHGEAYIVDKTTGTLELSFTQAGKEMFLLFIPTNRHAEFEKNSFSVVQRPYSLLNAFTGPAGVN